jgi:hypothetical protein
MPSGPGDRLVLQRAVVLDVGVIPLVLEPLILPIHHQPRSLGSQSNELSLLSAPEVVHLLRVFQLTDHAVANDLAVVDQLRTVDRDDR